MALELGEPDIDHLLSTLTSRQLAEWQAVSKIDGFPTDRVSLSLAKIGAELANRLRGANAPLLQPQDFLPYHMKDQQTDTQIETGFSVMVD